METREEKDKYMMITLKGRFKREVDERWHIAPICDKTQSGIPVRLWMECIMYRQVRVQGRTLGWLFEEKPGKLAKFGHYQEYFRSLVERVREDDSLWRSLQRGAVLKTTYHKVDVQVIELINHWCKKEAAQGSEIGLLMRQVYTQVRSALLTMKEFSRAL